MTSKSQDNEIKIMKMFVNWKQTHTLKLADKLIHLCKESISVEQNQNSLRLLKMFSIFAKLNNFSRYENEIVRKKIKFIIGSIDNT